MTEIPTPGDLAPRFGRRKPVRAQRAPRLLPHGWSDDLTLPPSDRHFYLDTGIFHSLAGVDEKVRDLLLSYLDRHEHNDTIRDEVLTQRAEPLYTLRIHILQLAKACERRACRLPDAVISVETIRNELMADSQRRHPGSSTTQSRGEHGGEAELIHLAGLHQPTGVLASNDAGASAVANKHGVGSFHFVHVVRAAVADGFPVDDGLKAAREGLKVSQLAANERSRTCNEAWLGGQSRTKS